MLLLIFSVIESILFGGVKADLPVLNNVIKIPSKHVDRIVVYRDVSHFQFGTCIEEKQYLSKCERDLIIPETIHPIWTRTDKYPVRASWFAIDSVKMLTNACDSNETCSGTHVCQSDEVFINVADMNRRLIEKNGTMKYRYTSDGILNFQADPRRMFYLMSVNGEHMESYSYMTKGLTFDVKYWFYPNECLDCVDVHLIVNITNTLDVPITSSHIKLVDSTIYRKTRQTCSEEDTTERTAPHRQTPFSTNTEGQIIKVMEANTTIMPFSSKLINIHRNKFNVSYEVDLEDRLVGIDFLSSQSIRAIVKMPANDFPSGNAFLFDGRFIEKAELTHEHASVRNREIVFHLQRLAKLKYFRTLTIDINKVRGHHSSISHRFINSYGNRSFRLHLLFQSLFNDEVISHGCNNATMIKDMSDWILTTNIEPMTSVTCMFSILPR